MEYRFVSFHGEFPTTLLSKTSLNATDLICISSTWLAHFGFSKSFFLPKSNLKLLLSLVCCVKLWNAHQRAVTWYSRLSARISVNNWFRHQSEKVSNSMLFIMVIEVIHGLRNQQPDLKSFSVVLSLLIFLLSLLVLFLPGFGFPIPGFPEGRAARSLARDTRATCKLHGVRATQHPARNHSSTAMTNSTSQ